MEQSQVDQARPATAETGRQVRNRGAVVTGQMKRLLPSDHWADHSRSVPQIRSNHPGCETRPGTAAADTASSLIAPVVGTQLQPPHAFPARSRFAALRPSDALATRFDAASRPA